LVRLSLARLSLARLSLARLSLARLSLARLSLARLSLVRLSLVDGGSAGFWSMEDGAHLVGQRHGDQALGQRRPGVRGCGEQEPATEPAAVLDQQLDLAVDR
jgi:uncharacterized protein YjbI with pentapeptide repeats